MRQYHDLLAAVLDQGVVKGDRTGTGTRSLFGAQMRFDLADGFPLVTTKLVRFNDIVAELLWFISGDTNVQTLQAQGVTIWDEWADEDGDLGPVYGKQWRAWRSYTVETGYPVGHPRQGSPRTIDQLTQVLDELVRNPDSRRLVVSAWNVADLPDMALAPCHCLFQFYARPIALPERLDLLSKITEHYELDDLVPGLAAMNKAAGEAWLHTALDGQGVPARYLDCQLYQRSADLFLGVPYNIASYTLLLMMVARDVGMVPGHLVHSLGDAHVYSNHVEQVEMQLERVERAPPLPRVHFTDDAPRSIFKIRREHVVLEGYSPLPAIKAPVSV